MRGVSKSVKCWCKSEAKAKCPGFSKTELIFFRVCGVLPCFGFRRKTVDSTLMFLLLLSGAAQSQGHFSFWYCPASKGAGDHKERGGDTAGTADLHCPKG